ncbi:MAG: methyltransferase domain-containing protein [Sphaerochaetaceae bacterium]
MRAEQFWDRLAHGYDKSTNSTYAEAYKKSIEISKKYLAPKMTLLDIGCGTGIITNEIADSVTRIDAIDYSKKMIEEAKNKALKRGIGNINYAVDDITHLANSGNLYDCVTAYNVLYFMEHVDETLRRINSIIIEKGLFIAVTDCLGEKKTFKGQVTKLFQKLGIFPFMEFFSIADLRKIICNNGFTIIEETSLYPAPPNYCIVARKQ